MKKRTSIILVSVSLIVMSVAYYLIKYVTKSKTVEHNALAVLFTLLAVLVLYIAYKELIRRFSRKRIPKEEYAFLYGLEKQQITGEVEFYFTLSQPKNVNFSILNSRMEELQVLADKEFGTGGHILRYDTNALQNGIYFYCLRSDNQKTLKRMIVQHDNLTA